MNLKDDGSRIRAAARPAWMNPGIYPSLSLILAVLFLAGCGTVGSQVQAGRRELLYGDPNNALTHFQRAAEQDPQYRYYSALPEGVWTYVGRAYYSSGRLPEARTALERAVSQSKDDNLARLYLGLVLARDGNRQNGLRDIETGMRGIHDWLDYVEYHFAFSYGRFWDPRKEIRSEIRTNLAMISGGVNDWPKLIAGGEWVGKKMEEEMDRARLDEIEDYRREGEGKQP